MPNNSCSERLRHLRQINEQEKQEEVARDMIRFSERQQLYAFFDAVKNVDMGDEETWE